MHDAERSRRKRNPERKGGWEEIEVIKRQKVRTSGLSELQDL